MPQGERTNWCGAARLMVTGLALAVLAIRVLPGPAAAEGAPSVEECLACHEEDMGEVLQFADGSTLSIVVDPSHWSASVHSDLTCVDCHRQIADYPHEEVQFESARAYQIDRADTCKRCHHAYYSRVLDGIHYRLLADGNSTAPTCVDCHGAHDVTDPKSPRIAVDRRCARCHEGISGTFASSVHGRALREEANEDVPVCTDCHGAHAIEDPRKPGFHAKAHDLCAPCHGDQEKMEKYGLNPNVLTTYLEDFHGVSNSLYVSGAGAPSQPMASCVDCHGVHDIQRMPEGGSPEEVRERVVQVCRRCHENVPPAFADAWLSHYTPSLSSAPLVWLVRWSYRILIPIILLGLVLHVLLDLWQVRVRRRWRGGEHA